MWGKSDSSCDPSFGRSAPEVGTFHRGQRLPVLADTPDSMSPAQCYLSSLMGLVDQGRRRVVIPSRNFKATILWGLSASWTRYVAVPHFFALRSSYCRFSTPSTPHWTLNEIEFSWASKRTIAATMCLQYAWCSFQILCADSMILHIFSGVPEGMHHFFLICHLPGRLPGLLSG